MYPVEVFQDLAAHSKGVRYTSNIDRKSQTSMSERISCFTSDERCSVWDRWRV